MGADRSVRASFEEGRSKEDKISAVQYVTFDLTPDDVEALRAADARLVVDHENYHAEAVLSEATRAELLRDLG